MVMYTKVSAVNEKVTDQLTIKKFSKRIRAFKVNQGESYRFNVEFMMASVCKMRNHIYIGYMKLQKQSEKLHSTLLESGIEAKIFLENNGVGGHRVVDTTKLEDILFLNFKSGEIFVDVDVMPNREQYLLIIKFLKNIVQSLESGKY